MSNTTPQTQTQPQPVTEDTKTIITVLLLVLMYPVGVIVMWFWPRWKAWVKIILTAVGCLPILLALVFFMIIGITESGKDKNMMPITNSSSQSKSMIKKTTDGMTETYTNSDGTYSVSYPTKKYVKCNVEDTPNAGTLTLWKAPYNCEKDDGSSYINVSEGIFFKDATDEENLMITKPVTVDGVKGTRKTYKFTTGSRADYPGGGMILVSVKSAGGEMVNIALLGKDAQAEKDLTEMLNSFKWLNK